MQPYLCLLASPVRRDWIFCEETVPIIVLVFEDQQPHPALRALKTWDRERAVAVHLMILKS